MDPHTSRWQSADPAGFDLANPESGNGSIIEGINWYIYCNNNPLKFIDPTGLYSWLIVATFQGGGNENVGTTFIDAANTRAKDIRNSSSFNPDVDTVTVVVVDSMQDFADALAGGGIDEMEMFGHGNPTDLIIGSGEGTGKSENLNAGNINQLNADAFNEGASIKLNQCKTANENLLGFIEKLFGAKTIAETMSDYFGVSVTGNVGGATAVPSPDAEIDYSYRHKQGDDVYYTTAGDTVTYEP